MSRADFPVGERYPAGTTDKLMADFLKYHEVPGLSKELPYPQKEVDKNQNRSPWAITRRCVVSGTSEPTEKRGNRMTTLLRELRATDGHRTGGTSHPSPPGSPQLASAPRRASDRRPTPRLRHLRRAATQQACVVSGAGNEGLSAGGKGGLGLEGGASDSGPARPLRPL